MDLGSNAKVQAKKLESEAEIQTAEHQTKHNELKSELLTSRNELLQAQDNVRQAAEFGSQLIQQVQALTTKAQTAQQEADQARDELAEVDQRNSRLASENRLLQEQLQLLEQDAALDEKAVDEIRQRAADATEKERKKQRQLNELQDQVSSLTTDLTNSEEKRTTQEEELLRAKAELKELNSDSLRSSELQNTVISLEDELQHVRDSAQAEVEDLQSQVDGLQTRYDELYSSSNTLRATLVERFTGTQHALEAKVARLQEALRDVQDEKDAGSNEAASLANEMGSNERVDSLEAKVAELEAALSTAALTNSTMTQQQRELQSQTETLETQVAELRKSKDILDKSVASLQAKVEQLSGKLVTKSSKANTLEDELTAASKALSQAAREAAKAQRQLDKVKADLERSKSATMSVQQQLDQRSEQLLSDQALLRAELEENRSQAETADATFRQQLLELAAERDAIKESQAQLAHQSSRSAEQHAADLAMSQQHLSKIESLKETAATQTAQIESLTSQLTEVSATRQLLQQQLDAQALELQRTSNAVKLAQDDVVAANSRIARKQDELDLIREELEALQTELETVETEGDDNVRQLEARLNTLKSECERLESAHAAMVAQLTSEGKAHETVKSSLETQLTETQAELATMTTRRRALEQTTIDQSAEISKLQDELNDAKATAALVVQSSSQAEAAQGQAAQLEQQLARAKTQLAEARLEATNRAKARAELDEQHTAAVMSLQSQLNQAMQACSQAEQLKEEARAEVLVLQKAQAALNAQVLILQKDLEVAQAAQQKDGDALQRNSELVEANKQQVKELAAKLQAKHAELDTSLAERRALQGQLDEANLSMQAQLQREQRALALAASKLEAETEALQEVLNEEMANGEDLEEQRDVLRKRVAELEADLAFRLTAEQAKHASLDDQLASKQAEVALAQENAARAQRVLKETQALLKAYKEREQEAARQLQALQEEHEDVKTELEETGDMLADVMSNIEGTEADKAKAESKLKAAQQELEEIGAREAEASLMVTTLQAQVDGQQQALNEVRDANQAQSLALSKERARLQTALEKIDEVGLLIETIQAEAAEELAEETRKKEAYNEEVSSLMGFVTELNEELQLLKNERAEREHELAELKEAVDDQQRAAAFELEGALSDKDKAELTLVRVQQALELAQTATKNAEARAKFAEDEVVELETEKNKLFREIDELLVIQTDLNEELKVYKEDQMGEDDVQGLLAGLSNESVNLEEYRHKLEDLSAQMKAMAAHETRINNELERANARVESLEKQIEDVTSERDRQISELHELMTIQTELNDELRLLKGDAGTSRAEKGLFGNQSLTQTRLDDTEEELKEVRAKLKMKEVELTQAQADAGKLSAAEAGELTEKIVQLEKEKQAANDKLDSLMGFVTASNAEVTTLKAAAISMQTQHDEAAAHFKKQLETAKVVSSGLEAIVEGQKSQFMDLERELEALRSEKAQLDGELSEVSESLEYKTRECRGLIEEVNDLMEIRRELNDELEAATEQNVLDTSQTGLLSSRTAAALENAEFKDVVEMLQKQLNIAAKHGTRVESERKHEEMRAQQLSVKVDEIDQRCQELQGEVNQLLSLNKALNEELQALRDAQPDSVNVTGLLSRSTATHIQDFLDQDTQDSIASQPNPPTSQTVVSSASVGLQEAAASTPGPLASTPSKQPMKRTSSETAASGQSAGDLNAMSNFFAQLQS